MLNLSQALRQLCMYHLTKMTMIQKEVDLKLYKL